MSSVTINNNYEQRSYDKEGINFMINKGSGKVETITIVPKTDKSNHRKHARVMINNQIGIIPREFRALSVPATRRDTFSDDLAPVLIGAPIPRAAKGLQLRNVIPYMCSI